MLEFPGVEERMTLSIGFCSIDSNCPLTDREIEKMANKAKSFAKAAGKNRLATYRDTQFHEKSLCVID
jgi:GGDEF domain-containing protein